MLSSDSAALGTTRAFGFLSASRKTRANMPGRRRSGEVAASVTLMVPVAASTTGLIRSTLAGNRSPGHDSTRSQALWPMRSRLRSRSGTWIGQRSGSKSEMR